MSSQSESSLSVFESNAMPALMKFLHLAAAIVWLGGISFMLFALRPAAATQLAPPQRLPLLALVLDKFFKLVWPAIGLLLLTGLAMLLAVGMKNAPTGWHLMLGIGLLMFALFGHLYFGPYRRLKLAVAAADWPEGGRRVGQIASLALLNLVLGALAIAAVLFLA
ncbi:CopD family protein [Polaromonas sp. SM01]|uniref:CopD family protein n=1 Tax=Polaromonas sp. SM01 TaxID=3085630 RepID=UPI0039907D0D